jgi:hypothetical protein
MEKELIKITKTQVEIDGYSFELGEEVNCHYCEQPAMYGTTYSGMFLCEDRECFAQFASDQFDHADRHDVVVTVCAGCELEEEECVCYDEQD